MKIYIYGSYSKDTHTIVANNREEAAKMFLQYFKENCDGYPEVDSSGSSLEEFDIIPGVLVKPKHFC